jgi:adenylate kinase
LAGKHIVILGPPGSGKGTQAVRIAEELDLRHLSTGDILRDAVAGKTPLGRQAEDYMKQGALVPDDVVLGLIDEELEVIGNGGWILDGFPRTLVQAEALSEMLEARSHRIDHVLLIDVDPEVIVERLTSRRVCPNCNAVYNLDSIKTAMPGACDVCGTELVKRPDDEEETVRQRLRVYEEQTSPLVVFYEGKGGLIRINGASGIGEITAEILRMLK